MSSSSSSYSSSRSSVNAIHRRTTPQTAPELQPPIIEQAPNLKPIFHSIAFAFVLLIFFGFLQFLPATRFLDISDPFGNSGRLDSVTSNQQVNATLESVVEKNNKISKNATQKSVLKENKKSNNAMQELVEKENYKSSKVEWNDSTIDALIKICVNETLAGNCANEQFNKLGWSNIINKFTAMTGMTYDFKQIKSKWDALKNDWQVSGIGWDPVRQTIDAGNEWWNKQMKLSKLRALSDGKFGFITTNGQDDGIVHIVSWMGCLDLRMLAVLANSTLSGSRYPNLVHFHFFIPKGNEDKVSFFKLKVLFPHSYIEIHGQEEVKEAIRTAMSGVKHSVSNFEEIAPFFIPSVHRFLGKFVYISPYVIVKGRVEELIGVDLSTYAVAAAENNANKLNNYVNLDILNAIQRSASKPWVSETPYKTNSYMPDLSVLLIDAKKLEQDHFLEAFLWWSKVLMNERSSGTYPALALALYNRYLKLPSPWLIRDSTPLVVKKSLVIHYDGPKTICSESSDSTTLEIGYGHLWKQYLPPLSDQIAGS